MAASLIAGGDKVIVADIKPIEEWDQVHESSENIPDCDLSLIENCRYVTEHADEVYMFAADMGGMGFIENNKLACMLSVLPSTHMLVAAADNKVKRYFYSSSACVYAADKQTNTRVTALKEADAYPAEAEDGYGWEKLFTERMCRHFFEDSGLITRVARFHNVYGPHGTYQGGREKAPAAICRKVLEAKTNRTGHIDIWGDGEQTRSFMYIDDCIQGVHLIMGSKCEEPLNLGSSELVSVNQLVTLVESIAGVELYRTYDLSAPQGVRGRNSDNTRLEQEVGWSPSISLYDGLKKTYDWISKEMYGE